MRKWLNGNGGLEQNETKLNGQVLVCEKGKFCRPEKVYKLRIVRCCRVINSHNSTMKKEMKRKKPRVQSVYSVTFFFDFFVYVNSSVALVNMAKAFLQLKVNWPGFSHWCCCMSLNVISHHISSLYETLAALLGSLSFAVLL